MKTPGCSTVEKGSSAVLSKLNELYVEAFNHEGFAEIRVEMRLLRRGQKEIILHCGKQYRYVIDYSPSNPLAWEVRREAREGDTAKPRVERRKRQEAITFPDRRKRNKD